MRGRRQRGYAHRTLYGGGVGREGGRMANKQANWMAVIRDLKERSPACEATAHFVFNINIHLKILRASVCVCVYACVVRIL